MIPGIITDTLRILVVDASTDKFQVILHYLKDQTIKVRPKLIHSLVELNRALEENTPWDICICKAKQAAIPATTLLSLFNNKEKATPVFVIAENPTKTEKMKYLHAGASEYLPADDCDIFLERLKLHYHYVLIHRRNRLLQFALRKSEQQCEFLLDSSREAIAYINEDHAICYSNRSFNHLFSYQNSEDLHGVNIADLISPGDEDQFKDFLKHFHHEDEEYDHFECHGRRSDKTEFKIDILLDPVEFRQQVCTQVIVRLIKEQEVQEHSLDNLKKQDLLTGFYNQQYFNYFLDEYLSELSYSHSAGVLLYIEMQEYKSDTGKFGASERDLITGEVADVIKHHSIDIEHEIGRYGSQSFTILLHGSSLDEAKNHADLLYDEINNNIATVEENVLKTPCQIGLAIVTENVPSSQELLARAYSACKQAATLEKRVHIFQKKPGDSGNDEQEKEIVNQVHQALESGQFQLKYQPIVSLNAEPHEYYEVLVRLQDDENQNIRPDNFFPAAKSAGLLSKIDRWVILHAIEVLAAHRLQGHNTFMLIMLSMHSVLDETLLPWLSIALQNARLPSDVLLFELNESDCAMHISECQTFIKCLRDLRCKSVLTRFGSGLDSFKTLKLLDVDFVKFDGSYTQEITKGNKEQQEELTQMIAQVHQMGKLTIVPMVEEARIMPLLWQMNTNYIQGYFLHPPTDVLDYEFTSDLDMTASSEED